MSKSDRGYRWMKVAMVTAVLVAIAIVTPGDRARAQVIKGSDIGFCDGSVRTLTAGPFTFGPNDSAKSRILLPAVQRARATVSVVDSHGNVLYTQEFSNTDPATGAAGKLLPAVKPYFGVAFDLSMDERGTLMFGDGSVRTAIGSFQSPEDLSVLIGLLLPAVQRIHDAPSRASWGSVQFTGDHFGTGQLLPYLEHPNLVAIPSSVQ
jgi:hypothetical protein